MLCHREWAMLGLGLLAVAGCAPPPAGLASTEDQRDEAPHTASADAAPEAASTSAPEAVAQLHSEVAEARAQHAYAAEQPVPELSIPDAQALPTELRSSVSSPLPGRAARTVLHEEVNEAENLFFTEDGRLFVSSAEDIYEIRRRADGSFSKTDHFHEDCVVEGIVGSGEYLYGVCWTLQPDLSIRSYLLGGRISENPVFRILGRLDDGVVANGMAIDPEGRIYVTYTSGTGEIVRLTFAQPLQLAGKELWTQGLPNVNGIKYAQGAFYVTLLDTSLTSQFVRIPLRADGSAGKPETLYRRWLTVLDDVLPFEDGFVITDFLSGTLIFWDAARGAYAETPARTFYGPTSLAQGRPPMFGPRQLIVAEKGNFLIRDERRGDLLSAYQLP